MCNCPKNTQGQKFGDACLALNLWLGLCPLKLSLFYFGLSANPWINLLPINIEWTKYKLNRKQRQECTLNHSEFSFGSRFISVTGKSYFLCSKVWMLWSTKQKKIALLTAHRHLKVKKETSLMCFFQTNFRHFFLTFNFPERIKCNFLKKKYNLSFQWRHCNQESVG